MINRTCIRASDHSLSIQQTHSTTENVLKTLARYLPHDTSPVDLEIYKTGYESFKNLHDINGLNYIEGYQTVINALNRRLEVTPEEEQYRRQIQKLENGLLLLEQCSPLRRHCLITNEVIPANNNTPQFIFINQCGLSSAGILKLVSTAKKYEDSSIGLHSALKEIADPLLQEKVDHISPRDIIRLRLHIEELKIFPPTLRGIACGFMIGGLTSVLILSLVSLSLPAFIVLAVLPSIVGVGAGLIIEKFLAKKELRNKIGPVPVFALAPSLNKLLTHNELKPHFWHALFYWRATPAQTISINSAPRILNISP